MRSFIAWCSPSRPGHSYQMLMLCDLRDRWRGGRAGRGASRAAGRAAQMQPVTDGACGCQLHKLLSAGSGDPSRQGEGVGGIHSSRRCTRLMGTYADREEHTMKENDHGAMPSRPCTSMPAGSSGNCSRRKSSVRQPLDPRLRAPRDLAALDTAFRALFTCARGTLAPTISTAAAPSAGMDTRVTRGA